MENFALMQIEKCERHLNHPVKNLVLTEILSLGSFDLAINVSTVAIHHYDVEVLLTVDIAVLICDNI